MSHSITDELIEAGSDVSKPHIFDFYLYFRTSDEALEADRRLVSMGYAVERRPAVEEPGWLCVAQKALTPSPTIMSHTLEDLERVVADFGGKHDGWEVEFPE